VLGRALATNASAGTYSVLLFGIGVNGYSSGGSSNILAVGSACNGCTISGSSTAIVYLVGTSGATLPSATGNAGQELILVATTSQSLAVNCPGSSNCLIFGGYDASAASSLAATGASSYTTVILVSNGSGTWYVVASS
jgi:hypothetical protein